MLAGVIACELGWLTTRMKRLGILRDLLLKLYDREAGIACDGPIPGACAYRESAEMGEHCAPFGRWAVGLNRLRVRL